MKRSNAKATSKKNPGATAPVALTSLDASEAEEIKPSDILEKVKIGYFVALKIQQYSEDLPQIGRVKNMNPTTVTVEWLVGSYTGSFSYWKEKGNVICETFPLRGIMKTVKLSQSMRLAKDDIPLLKKTIHLS